MSVQKGFTLIEILISISIVAIVMGSIITAATAIRRTGRDAQRQADLRSIQSALQNFYADQNYFPNNPTNNLISSYSSLTNCTDTASGCSVSKTYLANIPIDPAGGNYKYLSLLDSTSAVRSNGSANTCTATTNNHSCQFYILCAKLEGNSPQSTTQYSDCTTNFVNGGDNFQINP